MKNFWKNHGNTLLMLTVFLVICAVAVADVYFTWYDSLPRFQDVTMELGEPLPPVSAFLTELADPEKVSFVTEHVDVTAPGEQQITLRYGRRTETVTLTVQDTTAPVLALQDLVRSIDYEPRPMDFVARFYDLSATTLSFANPIPVPESYGDVTVEVMLTDAYGNSTVENATLSYIWMVDRFTLEFGSTLEKSDLLLNAEKDADLLDQAQLDAVNQGGIGEYTVTSTDQGQTSVCTVTVVDTTGPELVLKSLERDQGVKAPKLEDFVVSYSDLSGEVTLTLLSVPDTKKVSTQSIQVEAKDIYGNTTVKTTRLYVLADTTAPNFSGVGAMTVEKHSTPDYEKGVVAYDSKDGEVAFTYDASKVNTEKAGTYYVNYAATDSSGNRSTYRRKVTVKHDQEDTKALVAAAADKCGTSVEAIRDYVRDKISYSTSWGGDDPVYYGFTNKKGNCYVHALCLKAMLEYRGYSCKLIWVTDKSHYWVLVNMGGYWRHVDATPGSRHTKYSLMNDEQRYETLQNGYPQGRDWDRSKWPAAN